MALATFEKLKKVSKKFPNKPGVYPSTRTCWFSTGQVFGVFDL